MEERWMDISGYEGLYQVSDMGRVRTYDRIINCRLGKGKRLIKRRILKLSLRSSVRSSGGYLGITLHNDGYKNVLVSRLVCQHFIPNPNNKPCVNHKNGDKLDNRLDNLERCTYSENCLHAYRVLGRKPSIVYHAVGKHNKLSKKVNQYSLDGAFIKQWDCITDVEKEVKICRQNISACCKGNKKHSTAGGYKREYA